MLFSPCFSTLFRNYKSGIKNERVQYVRHSILQLLELLCSLWWGAYRSLTCMKKIYILKYFIPLILAFILLSRQWRFCFIWSAPVLLIRHFWIRSVDKIGIKDQSQKFEQRNSTRAQERVKNELPRNVIFLFQNILPFLFSSLNHFILKTLPTFSNFCLTHSVSSTTLLDEIACIFSNLEWIAEKNELSTRRDVLSKANFTGIIYFHFETFHPSYLSSSRVTYTVVFAFYSQLLSSPVWTVVWISHCVNLGFTVTINTKAWKLEFYKIKSWRVVELCWKSLGSLHWKLHSLELFYLHLETFQLFYISSLVTG